MDKILYSSEENTRPYPTTAAAPESRNAAMLFPRLPCPFLQRYAHIIKITNTTMDSPAKNAFDI